MLISDSQDELHSGKLVLRLPKSLHDRAIIAAEREGVSLNTYLVYLISEGTRSSEVARLAGPSQEDQSSLYQKFWTELLEKSKTKTDLFTAVSPSPRNKLLVNAGKPGLTFEYLIEKHKAGVQLAVDPDKGNNRELYRRLYASRQDIEAAFGDSLKWHENKGPCYIWKWLKGGGYDDKDRWDETQDAMINHMIRLESALRPRIAEL
jgi:hypothetical protein